VYLLPELSLATSVELFVQRARAARPGADLPADAVEEVCRHLDGLPLAVELAAARVRVMSAAEIARRLEDRFALLRGGPRDAPERHQTLHAVVDWSWNLLEPAGQAVMRALSVFPGGFTADAARRLLDDGDASDVPPVLEHLVDQSLLQVADTPAGTRFRMLETVREFSTARREAAGERDRVVGGFLSWARDFGVARHQAPFGADPFAPAGADPRRAGQPRAGAPARAGQGGRGHRCGHLGRARGAVDDRDQLRPPRLSGHRDRPAAVALPARARAGRGHPDGPGPDDHATLPLRGPPRGLVAGRPAPAAPGPPDTVVRAVVIVLGAATGSARRCTSCATATSRWWPASPTASPATSRRTRATQAAR